ncbi:riboflavin synthase alpha chain [Oryzisolibacter propanilivorax]|uniref:Riboflavin synthase n=1 Tax=Oryzisolibacter propanilivorax TaxID=1527607 RepID=A0A1G9QA13_9BURK|nr:riboflavin synthase subunit alpha [Oryzisolibacter propanilivorax]SDM07799.1 riboflavin synthase alpha chain [Oryzisolibacter propanilivorax]
MFTGIVQATAAIAAIEDRAGLRTFTIDFPEGFCTDLAIGASVAVDGVCLTVTDIDSPTRARFDVMQQSLAVTTLGRYAQGGLVNVERAAKDGAEIGGHPLSGHIDFTARLDSVRTLENNLVWRVAVPESHRRYIFAKGYIALHGASLTVAEVDRRAGWFEVWLIPETRRATVFEGLRAGDLLNVEIERGTQVVVDTVREAVQDSLGALEPVLRGLLADKGLSLDDYLPRPDLPR